MSLRVMSADSQHGTSIYWPRNTFTSRMPSEWADARARVEADGRKAWVPRTLSDSGA